MIVISADTPHSTLAQSQPLPSKSMKDPPSPSKGCRENESMTTASESTADHHDIYAVLDVLELDGYDETSSVAEIRAGRSVMRRTVTLLPPPPPPPEPTPPSTPPSEEANKEPKKGFGKLVNDWKHMWDALNRIDHARDVGKPEAAKKKGQKESEAPKKKGQKENGRVLGNNVQDPQEGIWDPFLGLLPPSPETPIFEEKKHVDERHDTCEEDEHDPYAPVAAEMIFVHGPFGSSVHFNHLLKAIAKCIHSDIHQDHQEQVSDSNIVEAGNDLPPTPVNCNADGERWGIRCHLYDALGCGKSPHPASDWDAFAEKELDKDLGAIFHSVAAGKDDCNQSLVMGEGQASELPIFLVAHSYGTSQIIRLVNSMKSSERDRVKGVILLSGALADGPVEQIHDGNCKSCMWRLPDFVLELLQPKVGDGFVAVQPNAGTFYEEEAHRTHCSNDIGMAKAFYRQNKWCISDDAHKMKIRALLIHGEFDRTIPVAGGQHLNDHLPKSNMVIVPDAGHRVCEDQPEEVCKLLLNYVAEIISDSVQKPTEVMHN